VTRVVVIHGLGRTRLAMLPLARRLKKEGYDPLNVGYYAVRRPVADIAGRVAARLDALLADHPAGEPLRFVTHSLGGILARHYLGTRPHLRPARVVQLAPPNQGALIASKIDDLPLIRRIPGRTLASLRSGGPQLELPPLDPAAVEVGVIAGGKGKPGYLWLPEDSDGIVQVRETWLPEARDWILVPALHTWIMNDRSARANVLHFLEYGEFLPDAPRLILGADGRALGREA
jgi:pimeloyl-ACP methyl ester carboxylesterase